jgi:hypothetical protein
MRHEEDKHSYPTIHIPMPLKGTEARDFLPLVFFTCKDYFTLAVFLEKVLYEYLAKVGESQHVPQIANPQICDN